MVKSIWKYLTLGLFISLLGVFTISMFTQNKLKDRIIALQEQVPDTTFVEVHDTVTFDSIILKWKTRTEHDTLINLDTLKINDTIIILKEIESVPDSFSTTSRYLDSSIFPSKLIVLHLMLARKICAAGKFLHSALIHIEILY